MVLEMETEILFTISWPEMENKNSQLFICVVVYFDFKIKHSETC